MVRIRFQDRIPSFTRSPGDDGVFQASRLNIFILSVSSLFAGFVWWWSDLLQLLFLALLPPSALSPGGEREDKRTEFQSGDRSIETLRSSSFYAKVKVKLLIELIAECHRTAILLGICTYSRFIIISLIFIQELHSHLEAQSSSSYGINTIPRKLYLTSIVHTYTQIF